MGNQGAAADGNLAGLGASTTPGSASRVHLFAAAHVECGARTLEEKEPDGEIGRAQQGGTHGEGRAGPGAGGYENDHPANRRKRNHDSPPPTEDETNQEQRRYHVSSLRLRVSRSL